MVTDWSRVAAQRVGFRNFYPFFSDSNLVIPIANLVEGGICRDEQLVIGIEIIRAQK